ncbi:MAG: hypothetical protein A2Z16_11450 [Chloroflexi bacterium RBG_16_54_18]|nr:MAG: hypothetical protein A2Z16_11450 [Chloroflexi bacterium RBG_16_54_18]
MNPSTSPEQRLRQAIIAWGVFILVAVLINGTIPFVLGYDLHAWSNSIVKVVLFSLLIYAGLFLVVPVVITKGWPIVHQPAFWGAVLVATLGIVLWWPVNRFTAGVVVLVLAFLHWRFDLSELGFRSYSVKADLSDVLLMGILSFLPVLIRGLPANLRLATAFQASMERLFGNPASTVENLFYFGFLAESLARKTGRWLTPVLIGGLYTLHEMSNPEYWYSHLEFGLVFVGITLTTAIYLWRRSVVVVWLGDGLSRFITRLT